MTTIIDGKKIKDDILNEVKEEISKLSFVPVFCDILVGDDIVSTSYVSIKSKAASYCGVQFHSACFPSTITTKELVVKVKELNNFPNMCGIIVQLPLPKHIDKRQVLNAIDSNLDVDCLSDLSNERFYRGDGLFSYPTALACMRILDSLDLDLSAKKIAVLGEGMLVGSPVAHLLKRRNLNVYSVNSQTKNSKDIIKNADVVFSAIGRGKFITGDMIKEGAVIVDAGTSEEDGGVVGDVDLESARNVASFLTPTPGGVGPVTVAMLLKNILISAKRK